MFRFAIPRRNVFSMAPRRSIFSMSRLPLKVEQRVQQGQAPIVRGVRIRQPKWTVKKVVIAGFAIYAGYEIYCRIVFGPLEKGLEGVEMPEEDEEEVGGSIFLPFPGTTKEIKPKPYRGSDPEWQEFIKFSKDQALAKTVRDELAQFVRYLADKHPGITLRYGKGIKLRRYWLDVDFPTHPPPEFERSGIEIADDFVAWSTMPVDSSLVLRFRQIVWPSALVQSLWAFTKVVVADDSRRLARVFGFQGIAPPPTMEQLIAHHQAVAKQHGLPTPAGPPPKPKQPQPTLGDSQKTMVSTTATDKDSAAGKESSDAESWEAMHQALTAHFFRGAIAFKQKFAQTWRPAPSYPPRGSIQVSGLVELDSPKAWLVFDVKSAWDPKTKQFDPRSMQLKLRRMQMKKQGPLGGQ